jgi:hypothetical protein
MEILKRAKGEADGELVAFNENEANVREEVNRRASKAGLTTKCGECPRATKIQTSVAFGRRKLNAWPRDEHGNLIE